MQEKVVNPFFQDGVQHFPDFFETGLITEDHGNRSRALNAFLCDAPFC